MRVNARQRQSSSSEGPWAPDPGPGAHCFLNCFLNFLRRLRASKRIRSVRSGTTTGNKSTNSSCCIRIVKMKAHRNLQTSKFLSTVLLTDHAIAGARRARAAQDGTLNINVLLGFASPCVRASPTEMFWQQACRQSKMGQ